MTTATGTDNLHKIVILNPKGGCGKTTLATNIASYYAQQGPPPTLMDCDSQGYSMRWLAQRDRSLPDIHGIPAYEHTVKLADSVRLDGWLDSETVIFDLPGSVSYDMIHSLTYDANSIIIPVMPSAIDVYSASRFIAELLLVTQLDRRYQQLAVVANRTREATRSYRMLMRFLTSLKIPLIAILRDSQNYVHAASKGMGIYEMPAYRVAKDIEQMSRIVAWLDQWRMRRLDAVSSADFEHIPGAQVLTPTNHKHPR